MAQEHPFAQYVRILGKGKKGSRSLDRDEARHAMGMILDDQVRPEQLGAFLMLLRVKEEAPEELAGFADAVRERYQPPAGLSAVVDWASYAGKKRHLPWFLLSALVLAEQGTPVFMHGARGHTPGRIYTEDMLKLFGLPSCRDWQQVGDELGRNGFAFLSIDQLCPPLGQIIQLRSILGLRSPVHTLCRMLNPLNAEVTIDGVFHPPYAPMHQKTAQLLGTHQAVTVRGDGGEAEVKPDSDCDLHWIVNGELSTGSWPRIYPQRLVKDESLDPEDLLRLWRGELEHPYGEGAVISTLAMVLRLLKPSEPEDQPRLLEEARRLWSQRDRQRF
ncbi:glycosyl transferase family protein [Marinobacterium sp. YM272]|uniref:glycosyl transferase family protein n=1 Tax=Marinobacterium sp. YM272 TaxID=3421654 RepID=UPI003D7F3D11